MDIAKDGQDAQDKRYSRLLAKAAADKDFKQRLIADPGPVLAAEGIAIPSGVDVRVIEDPDGMVHVVLGDPPAAEELSDDALEQVAGGHVSPGDYIRAMR